MNDKQRLTDEEVEQAFGVPKILRAFSPGDIVIVECDREISDDEAQRMKEIVERTGLKAIVLGPGLRLVAKEQRGFTLIELMIGIAIVSLLAAIVLPLFVEMKHDLVPIVSETCLAYGYPRNAYSHGEAYCIRTLNGTDEVVTLRDLRERDQSRVER